MRRLAVAFAVAVVAFAGPVAADEETDIIDHAYYEVMHPYLAKREGNGRDLVAWLRMREPYREWSSESSWCYGPRDDEIAWCRYQ